VRQTKKKVELATLYINHDGSSWFERNESDMVSWKELKNLATRGATCDTMYRLREKSGDKQGALKMTYAVKTSSGSFIGFDGDEIIVGSKKEGIKIVGHRMRCNWMSLEKYQVERNIGAK